MHNGTMHSLILLLFKLLMYSLVIFQESFLAINCPNSNAVTSNVFQTSLFVMERTIAETELMKTT